MNQDNNWNNEDLQFRGSNFSPYEGNEQANANYGNTTYSNQSYDDTRYNNSYYGYDGSGSQQTDYYTGGAGIAYDPIASEERAKEVLGYSFGCMMIALFLSAASAVYVYQSGLVISFLLNPYLFFGILIGELVVVAMANSAMSKRNTLLSAIMFITYSVLNGMTFSIYLLAYAGATIWTIFLVTAIMFGVLSFIGLRTSLRVDGLGSAGLMLLTGVIALSIINLFFQSSALDLVIAVVGLATFIGLTIYDTKRIKEIAYEDIESPTMLLGLYGALQLYLDFINILLKLLRLFGGRGRD